MYRYEFIPDIKQTKYLNQVWDILCECDKDFVPPLSYRNDTKKKDFSNIYQKNKQLTADHNDEIVSNDGKVSEKTSEKTEGDKPTGNKPIENEPTENKPTEYFNNMIQQHFILAIDENDYVAGFLSFKIDYAALEEITKNIYMSTACIRKKDRGKRISGEFYEYVEYKLPEEYRRDKILTRTWSTNEKQIHIFTKRGYKPVKVLPNDRGPGIDTIYFLKQV